MKTELENVKLIFRSFYNVGFQMAIQCILLILFNALKTNFQNLEKFLLFHRISEQVQLFFKTTQKGFVFEAFSFEKATKSLRVSSLG